MISSITVCQVRLAISESPAGEIGAGYLAIDDGLLLRLVSGVEQSQSSGFVVSFEAFSFAGFAVKDVE